MLASVFSDHVLRPIVGPFAFDNDLQPLCVLRKPDRHNPGGDDDWVVMFKVRPLLKEADTRCERQEMRLGRCTASAGYIHCTAFVLSAVCCVRCKCGR